LNHVFVDNHDVIERWSAETLASTATAFERFNKSDSIVGSTSASAKGKMSPKNAKRLHRRLGRHEGASPLQMDIAANHLSSGALDT
jgi:hypothetical protein